MITDLEELETTKENIEKEINKLLDDFTSKIPTSFVNITVGVNYNFIGMESGKKIFNADTKIYITL